MKKIGIIGGLGPESTVDYYRGIIEAFKPTYNELGFPEIIIECLDLKRTLAWANENRWDKVVDSVVRRCEILEYAGAAFGAMTANTPHKVFDEIQSQTSLPLLSIVKATREVAQQENFKRLLLLGTAFTMQADFYQKEFDKAGIELVVPSMAHQQYIQEKIFSEIEMGIVTDSTRREFLNIVASHGKDQVEGVILGCTELPMVIKKNDIDIAYLDTVQIHIDAIVKFCLGD